MMGIRPATTYCAAIGASIDSRSAGGRARLKPRTASHARSHALTNFCAGRLPCRLLRHSMEVAHESQYEPDADSACHCPCHRAELLHRLGAAATAAGRTPE